MLPNHETSTADDSPREDIRTRASSATKIPLDSQPDSAVLDHHRELVNQLEPSRIFVFTDIDDTLLQSERKVPLDQQAATVGLDRKGQPISFITRKQRTLLSLLEDAATAVIPVTGRNRAALERVCYRFRGYSALSHGAVILMPDGRLCPKWREVLSEQTGHWSEILDRVHRNLTNTLSREELDARVTLVIDQGVCAYINIKGTDAALTELLRPIQDELERIGLRMHRNGHNAAVLPPYACKRRAVEHIVEQLGIASDDLVIALGDSLSDLPFMRAADFMLLPVASQIDQAMNQ